MAMIVRGFVSGVICAIATLTLISESDARAFRDCDNCPEMVVIPAGSFTMGSPKGEADRSSDAQDCPAELHGAADLHRDGRSAGRAALLIPPGGSGRGNAVTVNQARVTAARFRRLNT